MENIRWFLRRVVRPPVSRTDVDDRLFGWSPVFVKGLVVWLIALALLLIVADEPIAAALHRASGPLITIAAQITLLGDSGWMIAHLLVALLLLLPLRFASWGRKRALVLRHVSLDLFFALYCIVVSGLLVSFIKNLLGRARPKLIEEHGYLHFDPFEFAADYASFPSGHSTTFGAACMVLALRWPGLWKLWLALAVIGGTTRVLVGAHYPSDVFVGLTFGALFAWWTARFLAQRGVMFRFRADSLMPQRQLPRAVRWTRVA